MPGMSGEESILNNSDDGSTDDHSYITYAKLVLILQKGLISEKRELYKMPRKNKCYVICKKPNNNKQQNKTKQKSSKSGAFPEVCRMVWISQILGVRGLPP